MIKGSARTAAALLFAAAVSVFAVATATVGGASSDTFLVKGPTRPNVLFIVTDDQRSSGTLDVMPNTRRQFMSQGTYFPRATVTTPLCCPSRSSIFSGRYAHNHNVRRNTEATNLDQNPTLQHYLQQDGYTTGIFGKFLNDWDLNQNPPYWDKWAIFNNGNYDPTPVNEQGTVKTVGYSTTYVSDQATQFVEQAESDDKRPWFLYVAPEAPHFPSTPEAKYANASVPPFQQDPAFFEADRSDKPPYVQSNNLDQSTVLAERISQLRTLKSVDDMVARIFATLRNAGETRDTLAIFLSDNGFLWGDHGLRAKPYPYVQDVKVPFFVWWPGHVRAGAVDQRMVANVDLAPTVLDLLGISPTVPMDGWSLLDENHVRTRWFIETFTSVPLAETLTSSFEYTEYYDPNDMTTVTFREYYDLTNDPYELTNLLSDGNPNNDPPTGNLSQQLANDRVCSAQACP